MNDEYEPAGGMIPPGKLVQSFLIIAGGYMMFMVCLFGSYLAIAILFFPAIFQMLEDPELVKEAMQADPESVLPRKLFWMLAGVTAFFCLLIGWATARLSPFGKFSHAVFLAVLIFVSCLQQAIGAPQSLKWMFVALMCVFPIAILFGAKLAVSSNVIAD